MKIFNKKEKPSMEECRDKSEALMVKDFDEIEHFFKKKCEYGYSGLTDLLNEKGFKVALTTFDLYQEDIKKFLEENPNTLVGLCCKKVFDKIEWSGEEYQLTDDDFYCYDLKFCLLLEYEHGHDTGVATLYWCWHNGHGGSSGFIKS